MSRLVIGISAGVTAFILALTAGAVYAYRNMQSTPAAVQQQPAAQVATTLQLSAPPAVAPAAPAAAPAAVPANVSPQDAAAIAAKSINRTDLYSVEMTTYQSVQAYKVTFSSGDIVYVSLTGQVLGTEPPPAPVFMTQSGGGGGSSQRGGGGGGGGWSDSHDDHEGEGGGD